MKINCNFRIALKEKTGGVFISVLFPDLNAEGLTSTGLRIILRQLFKEDGKYQHLYGVKYISLVTILKALLLAHHMESAQRKALHKAFLTKIKPSTVGISV